VKRWLIPIAIVVPILAALGWLLFFSPWLAVTQVQVTVSSAPDVAGPLSADEVRVVAAIEPGTPLLRVDTGAIEQRVGELPQVQSVSASRAWPDAIVIDVVRRTPVALVANGSGYDVVDVEGTVMRSVGSVEDGVPVVRATGDGVLAAIAVASELPEEIRRQVGSIEASTRNDVTLILANGSEVMWGSADEGSVKAEVLAVLLKEVDARYYDVSAPGVPATSDMPRRASN
jgi:cell division protein FtsQ